MKDHKYVVIDLETTGNSPKKGHKMIQFAAVVMQGGEIVEQYSSFVCPRQPIPAFIEELTGISDEDVKDAPLFSEIAPKIVELLDSAYFVAHNVLFDLSFLQEELLMAGYEGFYGPVLDTVEMARILFPSADSYKLSDLAIQEGLLHDRPHQADSDAYVTAELLRILFAHLESLPLGTVRKLATLSGGLKSDLDVLFQEWIEEREGKVEYISDELEEYRGIFLRKDCSEDCMTADESGAFSFPKEDAEKEALIKQNLASFEIREGQLRMMNTVYRAFENEQHALIEAGTGVGKTLAYLLPAIALAHANKQPVLISTYTVQLQEQLLQKDIPLLKQMIRTPFKAVVLKGSSHYIALEKFIATLMEKDDNYDTLLTKMQILVWLTKTTTGDRDELNLSSGGQLFWNRIKHDGYRTWKSHRELTKDYYSRTRKKAKHADLVITNHSLLLMDLAGKTKQLPHYDYCIIDEGHHLEKVASKQIGKKLDYAATRSFLSRMGQYEQKQLFYKLHSAKSNENQSLLTTYNEMMTNVLYDMDMLFKTVAVHVKKKQHKGQNRISYRLQASNKKESLSLLSSAERFLFSLSDVTKAIRTIYDEVKRYKEKTEKQEMLLYEVQAWLNDAEEIMETIRSLFLTHRNDEEYVNWVEMDTRAIQNSTTVYSRPIVSGHYLADHLFSVKRSVVITSATLSVNDFFQFSMHELGLDGFSVIQERISSPFHYEKQAKLIIPADVPEINAVSIDEYIYCISEQIISIAEATKGRMLILFTSYEMLRKTYELMKESGFLQDFSIMAQGITSGSRMRLTRNFQRFEKAILLGTTSFWEGIDIPGEDLSCLVIVRLPFSPPDEPVTEAKCAVMKRNGYNPFQDYSLPEAVLRFKQGFGRLIRSKDDRGVMIVFDRRIITSHYGKVFLESIPGVKANEMSLNNITAFIERWL